MDICWERGEEKRFILQSEAESYSGIPNTGKKEERVHAELQAQDFMHDRSHLITPDVSNLHAYQKMMQDHVLHEHRWHDKHFPTLAKTTSTHEKSNNVFETGLCVFWTS